jgi:formylglycine-generating enzyme required for sulfatase activity
VIDGLAQAMVEPAYSTQVRAPCGVLLGRLGDPRFHGPEQLCLPAEPLLGLVEVPAGPFLMGSDRKTVAHWNKQGNTTWFENELGHEAPQETSLAGRLGRLLNKRSGLAPVDIPYRYWIARYPVSNAQFQCFAEDGGYSERWHGCWTEAGRRWLAGERWTEEMDQFYHGLFDYLRERGSYTEYESYADFLDRLLHPFFERMRKDRPGERYWADPGYNAPTQPAVGVTWHEAVAYASWLTEKLKDAPDTPPELRRLLESGYRICLPSEAEWEKAARGGLQLPGANGQPILNPLPDRQWPWGAAWDPGLCNSPEGDDPVGWPSPLCMYPLGASPYRCADMVGNAWEWTRNAYRPYPFVVQPADGAEEAEEASLRVVRGGSWPSTIHDARCAVRNHDDPYGMLNDLGMRVVCAPLLS